MLIHVIDGRLWLKEWFTLKNISTKNIELVFLYKEVKKKIEKQKSKISFKEIIGLTYFYMLIIKLKKQIC